MGIYLCALNLFTGELTVVRLVAPALPAAGTTPSTASPSTIALDPTRTHLYAGNEYGPPGAVSAYSINRLTGDLTLLNAQPALGAPAHVSVDQSGKYLFSAEYSGSWFEVFPILPNGSLGPAVFQMQTLGNVDTSFRTKPATNAPPGSFAFSAHEGPNGHPHQMESDPSNQWVVGTDAGQDRIYVWKLTPGGTPPLTPAAIPFVNTPPGDGPRHFAFHPNGVWMYSIQEEASTIMFWRFRSRYGSSFATTDHPECAAGIHRYELHFGNPRFRRRQLRLRGKPPERHHQRFQDRPRWQPYSNKPRFNTRGLPKNIRHRSLRTVHGGW